jgi:uncharacterized phage protein (TIGR01671 family)
MNREIKFRVWDKVDKEWKPFANFDIVEWQMHDMNPVEEYDFQQWTGCYDKNRTPIYEGDILVADHDGGEGEANIGVVYFAAGTFMIDGDGPFYDHVFGHSPDILDNHTVIGNKFENSELLKA